jgi:DNA-binding MarR family transcriptional regulator
MARAGAGSSATDSGSHPTRVEDSIARVIAGWQAARPDLRVEAIAITARLARLHTELGRRLEPVFTRFGLRGADFAVLATLVRLAGESVSQTRLASELGLSAGTISLRIDRLVRSGLAQRQPDPDDGRGAQICLTDGGRTLFEACAPEHLANAQELLAGLDERERVLLGGLLGKLLYTLEVPDPTDELTAAIGVVVDDAPTALEQRRAVGLPPVAGLLVRHVEPTGPAAASGMRLGDLLVAANRRPLRSRHDLQQAMANLRGRRRTLSFEILRGTEPKRLQLAARATGAKIRAGHRGPNQ